MSTNFFKNLKNLIGVEEFDKVKFFSSEKDDILLIKYFNKTPNLDTIGSVIYLIHEELGYLFNFLNYKFEHESKAGLRIDRKFFLNYFNFFISSPFLWNESEFSFFYNNLDFFLNNFHISKGIVSLDLYSKEKVDSWKEILKKLSTIFRNFGFGEIKFLLKVDRSEKKENRRSLVGKKKKSLLLEKKAKLNRKELLESWKDRELFDFSIHTNFSTLDGIGKPTEYLESALEKGYQALAVTDHYNVQSFPEFSKLQDKGVKIIYGCEVEMIEDELPPYIFNNCEKVLCEDIKKGKYCFFDVETTGFFSSFNEIIEIGYIITENGEITKEKNFLICPSKEISEQNLENWYTSIDPNSLNFSPKISEILPILREDFEDCILVAHNAFNFDYGFLNKAWNDFFNEDFKNPIVDTLSLSWILIPGKKSYSLEKLSKFNSKSKIVQTHRALDDAKLLLSLFQKLLDIIEEKKILLWKDVYKLFEKDNFPNRGKKVKILVKNQKGLENLYKLITISHTKNLFKRPTVFRSEIISNRDGLLIGSSGTREGEIFGDFLSFNKNDKRKQSISFYDYVELSNPESFRNLWLNGQIRKEEIYDTIKSIIRLSVDNEVTFVCSNNVHYAKKKEKILKDIIVANEGMNGTKHPLYREATLGGKEDRFHNLPYQHLLSIEELVNNWAFLGNKEIIEKIVFENPKKISEEIGKVIINKPSLNYSITESSKREEEELICAYTQKANEIFGKVWPSFVKRRIEQEWDIIKGRYIFIYWLTYKVVNKTYEDKEIVGSRGSIGSSFIAFLCRITDLNPLPFYKFCVKCKFSELYETDNRTYSCYDYEGTETCPVCNSVLTMEGHNLPFETFFGWEGEKTPDIDLNFSGEYQKTIHNYVRKILGENSVYRIGTINTLSQQTSEIFWKDHIKVRKKLNSKDHIKKLLEDSSNFELQKSHLENLLKNSKDFDERIWFGEWIEEGKIKELEKKLKRLRMEKLRLENELKRLRLEEKKIEKT